MQGQRTCIVVMAALTAVWSITVRAEQAWPTDDTIDTSYYQAFCRFSSEQEKAFWRKQGALTVPQLVEAHRSFLKESKDFREETILASYMIVFGRVPTDQEIRMLEKASAQTGATCRDLIEGHLEYKRRDPEAFERNDPNDYLDFLAGRR